jgi:hypothetical protein
MFPVREWIMDSGAFTNITTKGGHISVEKYLAAIKKFQHNGKLLAAVAQDWMCEPFVLNKTGLTVQEHQQRTVDGYRILRGRAAVECPDVYIMPVLQGYTPDEYVECLRLYGTDLGYGAWVGVGSVCKRNGTPIGVAAVVSAIKAVRPDLRLHGFGIKKTALAVPYIRENFYSADSQAASFTARMAGEDANDPTMARRYADELSNFCTV